MQFTYLYFSASSPCLFPWALGTSTKFLTGITDLHTLLNLLDLVIFPNTGSSYYHRLLQHLICFGYSSPLWCQSLFFFHFPQTNRINTSDDVQKFWIPISVITTKNDKKVTSKLVSIPEAIPAWRNHWKSPGELSNRQEIKRNFQRILRRNHYGIIEISMKESRKKSSKLFLKTSWRI